MTPKDRIFIDKVMKEVRGRIPYPAKVEDYFFIEELQKELDKMLGNAGYHIAKHYATKEVQ